MTDRTFLSIDAITATSCLGTGLDATQNSLLSQHSGLAPCQFDTVALPTHVGAVSDAVDEINLPDSLQQFDCRNNRLALLGLQQDDFIEAVNHIKDRYGAMKVGVFLGTSTSGMLQTEKGYYELNPDTGALPDWVQYEYAQNTYSVAHFVRAALQLTGPAAVVSTACSSSAKVFAMAQRMLALGVIDAAIVGGVDSLCLTTLYGFHSLQLLSDTPCKPFDTQRNGISIGEAAVFALLTRQDEATPVDNLLVKGIGESSDAHHMSSPHPTGLGAQQAMRAAISQADLTTNEIDYIHLHGTATKNNDAAEGQAVAQVFGQTVPGSSTKGATGHCLGAAGGLSVAITALALKQQIAWGSTGTETLDTSIAPIDYLTCNTSKPIKNILSNSFGFGGSNCSIVIGLQDQA